MKNLFSGISVILLLISVLAGCTQGASTPPVAPTTAVTATQPPVAKATTPVQAVATPKTVDTPKPAASPETKAPAGAPYFSGKTIEVTVESAAGGGTDTIARIIAAHFPKYIPGNPKIIVRNQPGAQGALANNAFFSKAKPDGLALLMNSSGAVGLQLLGDPVVNFDLKKYRHIGNVGRAESVMMVRTGYKSRLSDPTIKPLIIGTREGSESWQSMAFWGKEFLGWNIRWVPGYGGTSEMELAMRRNEMDMFATANAFIVNRMVQEKLMESVTTIGVINKGKFSRRPDFPDVPTFEEYMGNKKPQGIPWQAYIAWVGPGVIDKTLAAPPGTPDNILGILTDSYTKLAGDKQFDENIKKMVSEVYNVTVGKETDALMNEILSVPPEAVKYQTDLKARHYLN